MKVRKVESELNAKLGREATDEEIAAVAELPIDRSPRSVNCPRDSPASDQAVSDDGGAALGDLLRSDGPAPMNTSPRPIASGGNEIGESSRSSERNVIRLRFGLSGDEPPAPSARPAAS